MDVDVDDDHGAFVVVVCLHRQSFWHVAHPCDEGCEAQVSQPESADRGKSHL